MKKLLLSLGVLLCCLSAAHAQAEYPDVPFDDPAYADIELLVEPGILDNCYGPAGPRAMTRYEFAVVIARLLSPVMESRATRDKKSADFLSPTLKNSAVLAALKRLSEKFLPELTALGLDEQQVKNLFLPKHQSTPQKIPVAPPFSDVPKNHWAFNAVEKLRQGGILVGYPNGSLTK